LQHDSPLGGNWIRTSGSARDFGSVFVPDTAGARRLIAGWFDDPRAANSDVHRQQEPVMVFKPNYRSERQERDRLKQAKNEEKLRRQQERKTHRDALGAPERHPDASPET
jgi:hypothetical protein